MERSQVIRGAMRDFSLGLILLGLVVGLPGYIYATSPTVPEPVRVLALGVIIVSLVIASVAISARLWMDLTPVKLDARGLSVGRRLIRYESVLSVDWRPRSIVFRVITRDRARGVLVSKIGIEAEEEFLTELQERVSLAKRSATE
jgi:hypothetical protein